MLASFNHVHFSFGPLEVLKDITWVLEPDEVWGVIGRNGAGKSTLFKLLLGELEADSGAVVRPTPERAIRLGYYSQDLKPATNGNILEEALHAFADVERLAHEMRELEHAMSEPDEHLESVMSRYQQAQEAFERLDGFTIRARAESILFNLGFSSDMLNKKVGELSGGQRCRVMLAKAILQGQDLLLLDEPTNHLDLPSLRWLEDFVRDTSATVAVISHDRYFLDSVAASILEIEAGCSRVYEGNYTEFMVKKEAEIEAAEKAFELQQAYIKKQEEYIRRNIAGQNTKQARGRRTHLAKTKRLERPLKDRRQIKFKFPETQRCGDVALALERVSVGWNGEALFAPIEHHQVRRGQKLGIIGLNGTGKSTLLKAIAGQIPLVTGQCRLGSQVRLGYFDQHHSNLDARNNVFQQIQAVSPPLATKQDILGFLAKFQFRGDNAEKSVSVLSGGERARLSVATLIRQGCNLLLMDEPTNHMDIQSMEAMEDALLAFEGAVALVTHDRYLLGRVADCLLRIHENRAEFREGGYEDNQAWADLDLEGEQNEEIPNVKAKTPDKEFPVRERKPEVISNGKSQAIDKEAQKRVRKLEKRLEETEARVAELEALISQSHELLSKADPSDWKVFQDKTQIIKQLEEELMYTIHDWEKLQLTLDAEKT
ncbi:MAG: ABC-F family ATP-binding cassette domain-containing protein [Holophagales bacterium]|jgi:ATP-binding cassette subfamily F protein 3|nr:ABC-F family ATP-binding cassette domain-containing protein [Holophagales bacterium]